MANYERIIGLPAALTDTFVEAVRSAFPDLPDLDLLIAAGVIRSAAHDAIMSVLTQVKVAADAEDTKRNDPRGRVR